MKRLPGLMAAAVLALVLAQAQAQQQQGMQQGPRNFAPDFIAAAEQVGKAFNARVVVDPSIYVPAPPASTENAKSVEEALGKLVSGVKNVAWRKLYLTRSEANAGIPAARLAAIVRVVDTLETGGLVLENPGTKRALSVQKNLPVLPGFLSELESLNFATTPIYVIYSTVGGGSGATPQERFLDLQRQQLELLTQMDPDTLAASMGQAMQMLMSVDPQTRSLLLGNMMRAGTQMFMQMDPRMRAELVGSVVRSGMQMWASMPPAERERFMGEMMRMGQEIMGQMGGGPGRP